MKRSLARVFSTPHPVAVVTALFMYALAPQDPLHTRFTRLEIVAVGLIALLVTLLLRRDRLERFFIPLPIVALLVIMGVSIAQLPDSVIIRDYLAYVGAAVFAIVAVSAGGPRPVINGVAVAGLLIMVTAALYLVFLTETGFDYAGFRGSFPGSNNLSISVMLTVPAMTAVRLSNQKRTFALRATLLPLALITILLSTGRTSLVTFIATMIAWGTYTLFLKRPKVGFVVLALELLSAVLIALNWAAFTSVLGKSASMSGRLPLWEAYLEAIAQRPITGYGWHFATFPDMPLGQFMEARIGLVLINANNDLLNWWALTGIVGAIVAFATVALLMVFGITAKRFATEVPLMFVSGFGLFVGGLAELSTMHLDGWFALSVIWATLAFTVSKATTQQVQPKWVRSFQRLTW